DRERLVALRKRVAGDRHGNHGVLRALGDRRGAAGRRVVTGRDGRAVLRREVHGGAAGGGRRVQVDDEVGGGRPGVALQRGDVGDRERCGGGRGGRGRTQRDERAPQDQQTADGSTDLHLCPSTGRDARSFAPQPQP